MAVAVTGRYQDEGVWIDMKVYLAGNPGGGFPRLRRTAPKLVGVLKWLVSFHYIEETETPNKEFNEAIRNENISSGQSGRRDCR